uniref:Dirigent protein n=1 Tax=Kadsura heteroclita TaxID=124781 RepID=A0A7U3VH46_9MAGN|nr:dirigent protein 13 [Kadsura heteroclita]
MGSSFFPALVLLILITQQIRATTSSSDSNGNGESRTLSFSVFQHEGLNKTGYVMVEGVAGPPVGPTTASFGNIYVGNDPFTTEFDNSSKNVGFAEGEYITTSMDGYRTLYIATYTLQIEQNDSIWNGTISVLGTVNNERNSTLPVVGGTGDFMSVQGYVFSYPVDTKDVQNVVYGVDFHLHWPRECNHAMNHRLPP